MTKQQQTWVMALRFGLYPQTKVPNDAANLHEPDGYTPLGVLCELARLDGVINKYDPTKAMPLAVQNWIGLRVPYSAPFVIDDNRTFVETAALIEKHKNRLFVQKMD